MGNQLSARVLYRATEWTGEDNVTGARVYMTRQMGGWGYIVDMLPVHAGMLNAVGLAYAKGFNVSLAGARAMARRGCLRLEKSLARHPAGREWLDNRAKEQRR